MRGAYGQRLSAKPAVPRSQRAAQAGAGPRRPTSGNQCDISVVVPAHSRFDVLDRCLDALHTQTFPPERYEVLVVTNGVADDAKKELAAVLDRWRPSFDSRLRELEIDEASIPLARNAGVEHARGRIVLQINEDTALSRPALQQHFATHERQGFDPRHAVVGGRRFTDSYKQSLFNYLYEAGPLYMPLHWPGPPFRGDWRWFVTCNLSSLREAYERFGVFDPAFKWGSDTELGVRWQDAGCVNIVNTNIISYHLHTLSFDSYKRNRKERVPFRFRRSTGRWPREATDEDVRQARLSLNRLRLLELDLERADADTRRLEEAFEGPNKFTSETVMGIPVRRLDEFGALLGDLVIFQGAMLHCAELLELMRGRASERRAAC
ncbi:MAG: glycosyltransferase family 2 protein [Candidatus Brocadiae bacterium]|nr:glycosyltransferase family 2 protein [Candidatus Brocadiia bacterium]